MKEKLQKLYVKIFISIFVVAGIASLIWGVRGLKNNFYLPEKLEEYLMFIGVGVLFILIGSGLMPRKAKQKEDGEEINKRRLFSKENIKRNLFYVIVFMLLGLAFLVGAMIVISKKQTAAIYQDIVRLFLILTFIVPIMGIGPKLIDNK